MNPREMQLNVLWGENKKQVEDLDIACHLYVKYSIVHFIKGLIKSMKTLKAYWDPLISLL